MCKIRRSEEKNIQNCFGYYSPKQENYLQFTVKGIKQQQRNRIKQTSTLISV
jgi:hypothetical protein